VVQWTTSIPVTTLSTPPLISQPLRSPAGDTLFRVRLAGLATGVCAFPSTFSQPSLSIYAAYRYFIRTMARTAARRAIRTRRHRPRRGGGAYRETTQALLRTFPELPTGPSGRRRTALTPALSDAHSSEPAVPAVSVAEEDTADYHYPDNDGSEEDAGSEFSHYSAASRTDDEMQDVSLEQPGHLRALPAKVWSKALSLVSPFDLARLRRTSKFFDELLQQESIWRGSRSNHLPGFPTPVLGLSEVEMLRLLFSYRCMLCNSGRAIKTYWPFRIRCCWDCLVANSTKVSHTADFPSLSRNQKRGFFLVLNVCRSLFCEPHTNRSPKHC
jgi:hypothetical protein